MEEPDEQLPVQPTPQHGVVDFKHLCNLLFNDTEYIKEMLKEFVSAMPENMEEMQEAVNQQKWERVAFLAHRLKSSLGIVPITNAMDMTHELEKAAQAAENGLHITGKMQELTALLDTACKEIAVEIRRMN